MAGNLCQPYRDLDFEGTAMEFQHMCATCSDARGGEWRWDTYNQPATRPPPFSTEIITEAEERAIEAASKAATDEASAEGAGAMECCSACDDGEASQQQPHWGVRFLTHAEERVELGKRIWTEVADQIPRAQHDGRLVMPQGAAQQVVDLEAMLRSFPSLPYVKPPPPAARAAALIDASEDGIWTMERMEQARGFFACNAANIEACLVMPEVTARAELIKHERYQVREDGRVIGCKLNCPGCGHNAFVLVGEVNVNSVSNVRFGYGNGKAVMPVSREHSCFNPSCPDVIIARTTEQLARLRALVAEGVTAANAIERKKVTELRRLGVSWFGHDWRVMKALPRKVRL